MAVQHIFNSPATDGTNSSKIQPSHWNSYHNQYMTIAGNTAGQSTVSGTNIVFQGGNNVTLSANTGVGAASIIISAYPQGAGMSFAGTNISGTVNTSGIQLSVAQGVGTSFAGTNISGTVNTSGIQLSVAAPSAAGYQDYFMLMGA